MRGSNGGTADPDLRPSILNCAILNHPGLQLDTLSPPETHFWIQVYIIACINTGLHHASPTQTFLSK